MLLQLFRPPPSLAGSFYHSFSSLNCFRKVFLPKSQLAKRA